MLELQGNALTFLAFYTESKVGKTGLTVTCDVYEGDTAIVTGGSAIAIGGGLYYYTLASGSVDANALYTAIFKTATSTVDQQHIPALWVVGRTWTTRIDATVSSRSSHSAADVWAVATRTLTSFGTLVTEIVAALTAVASQVITALTPDSNNDVERYRGDTWSLSWTDIGSLTGYVSLDFTIKDTSRLYDNDAGAVLKIRKNASGLNDGLLYLNGSTDGVTAGWGSITIDDSASGDITIAVSNNATYQLPPGTYSYDLQRITASGSTTLVVGNFTILADVTRAIS